eukprot:TRINITY_DN4483_c0_g1_i1.p1 TRINITY_DN4483_c0_g1~~TRINITY_DN4483_c0_g1_i1.p1  ORF type:complete len:773 (+),score=180.44 TRINITY_DN4483_c0_g1_i1:69-2387(+)
MERLKEFTNTPNRLLLTSVLALNFVLFIAFLLHKIGIWYHFLLFMMGLGIGLGSAIGGIFYYITRAQGKTDNLLHTARQRNISFQATPDWKEQDLHELAKQDEHKPIEIEGQVMIQLGGKKKTRAVYNCCIKGTTFYFQKKKSLGSKDKEDKIYAVPLTGTEIRRIEEKQGRSSKYTIEIMHPQRKIMYKVDYLYLISESAKDVERWYFALLQIGKKNTHAYLTPTVPKHKRKSTNDMKLSSSMTDGEKDSSLVRGYFMNFLANHGFDGSNKSTSMSLGESGSFRESTSNPGSPIFSPMMDARKSVHETTFKTHNKDHHNEDDEPVTDPNLPPPVSNNVNINNFDIRPESAHWFNIIAERFFQNIRDSADIEKKITEKFSRRMSEKIEEKGLQGYLQNVTIKDVDFGSRPPAFESIRIIPAEEDLALDANLVYNNGDARLTLSAKLNLSWFSTQVTFSVRLVSMRGLVHVRIPPFPAERFMVCFYEEPDMEFVIDMALGERGTSLNLGKVKEMIAGRIKLALVERFVLPNRKYFRIPGAPKRDPAPNTNPNYKVNVALQNRSTSDGLMEKITGKQVGQAVLVKDNRSDEITAVDKGVVEALIENDLKDKIKADLKAKAVANGSNNNSNGPSPIPEDLLDHVIDDESETYDEDLERRAKNFFEKEERVYTEDDQLVRKTSYSINMPKVLLKRRSVENVHSHAGSRASDSDDEADSVSVSEGMSSASNSKRARIKESLSRKKDKLKKFFSSFGSGEKSSENLLTNPMNIPSSPK